MTNTEYLNQYYQKRLVIDNELKNIRDMEKLYIDNKRVLQRGQHAIISGEQFEHNGMIRVDYHSGELEYQFSKNAIRQGELGCFYSKSKHFEVLP